MGTSMRSQRLISSIRFRFAWGAREGPEPPRAPAVPRVPFATPTLPAIKSARARAAAAGFTLIELMIAVVIVGILAAIAYPSYQDHMRKGRRSAAQSFMIDVATREQQYLIDARRYAGGMGALDTLHLVVPADVSRFYTVAIEPAAPTVPPSYLITAMPIAGSAQTPDGELTLDHTGAKTRKGQAGW
jgi:type IV pilus assembly protein PilE